MTEELTDRVGCEHCTEPDPIWSTAKLTDDGFAVWVCDCGRAEIETQSCKDNNLELWKHTVFRDEKGRFRSAGDD